MRNNISDADIQVPRPHYHPGPFETPLDLASAVMAICENNGIEVVALVRGVRTPQEASIAFLTDDVSAAALEDLRDADPTWTIITCPYDMADLMPALVSAVRNNRHAAVVVTDKDRLNHWLKIAGKNLVHVVTDDPLMFFGDVSGGAE
ncbi:hypothetical protein N2597_04335 [Rhizobium sophoriradicis]|uniref:hypothetical protein n=1 Tax=Rhizobium sophoriradicis TaxID=1535245 RepID=UPI00160FB075|nr:hypothetical protein N2597_04335 [Rhizobium leguminosarum bv. phaseoli]